MIIRALENYITITQNYQRHQRHNTNKELKNDFRKRMPV